jgi:hypothetical protein
MRQRISFAERRRREEHRDMMRGLGLVIVSFVALVGPILAGWLTQ